MNRSEAKLRDMRVRVKALSKVSLHDIIFGVQANKNMKGKMPYLQKIIATVGLAGIEDIENINNTRNNIKNARRKKDNEMTETYNKK